MGKICEGYFPIEGEPEIIDIVPGTHASSTFMAYLAFNKYALEQGGDIDAAFFLDYIGELYSLEAEYEKGWLSREQIKICRNNLKTKGIIIRLRSKLDALLSEDHPLRGELMEKALRYLNTFWTQLLAYTKDGSYTIDNPIAERFIRPLAGERKNSLFFGSEKMACASAAYHTIISTCKMQGTLYCNI